MTVTTENYLDLANIVINEVIGDATLAVLVGVVIITYFGVKYGERWQTIVALDVLWALFVISYVMNQFVLMVVLLVLVIPAYALFSRMVKR